MSTTDSDLVHDAAIQARARVGGELGKAISDHLWAVERIRPALTADPIASILDGDVLLAGRLAHAVLALQQPFEPTAEHLRNVAAVAVMAHQDQERAATGRALLPSEIVADAVDAVLAALRPAPATG